MKKYFAVKNRDDVVRMNSSSGGIFYSLALDTIENGGIVYGAAYDEEFNVYHKRITRKDEIKSLQGSKYTPSRLGDAFAHVKHDLKTGSRVLFSGTPCQTSALLNVLKDVDMDNLLVVDVVCHGTPQTKFFDEYKKYLEEKYNSKIVSLNMRYKNPKYFQKNKKKKYIPLGKVEPHFMEVIFQNGKKYISRSDFDIFYQLFDYFTREGCYACPFASTERRSDLTIGDFHEFSSKLGDFNDGNGVSLLIVNTPKGEDYFNRIKDKFFVVEKDEQECLQPALESPMKKPVKHDEFISDYEKNGFEYVIKKYTKSGLKFKIRRTLERIGILDNLARWKRGLK